MADIAITGKEPTDAERMERELKLAGKLHRRAYETGNPALQDAYQRAMLRYSAEVAVLASVAGDYICSLREETQDRVTFLRHKLDALMRLEGTPAWNERLHTQFVETLLRYEVTFDQAQALNSEGGAELTAQRTRELLSARGWCLWKCSVLGGEVIVVTKDRQVEGIPKGYPVYTETELKELFRDDISEATIQLVHEAKKRAGAVVTEVTRVAQERR